MSARVLLGILVITANDARAETDCGALSLACADGGTVGIRPGIETRSVPASLRSTRGTVEGMPFAIDAMQPSVVAGFVLAITWNPARWFYIGGDYAILVGPARASDRANGPPGLAIDASMTGWLRFGAIAGVRLPVGPVWLGAELSAGPAMAGAGASATFMGEAREVSEGSSGWTWRAEPRATILWPLRRGNLELAAGIDRGAGASSVSFGLAWSFYRLTSHKSHHKRH